MQLATDGMTKARNQVAEAQEGLSSGIKVDKPSDDPAAWAEGARASIRSRLAGSHGDSIGRSRDGLLETDRALGAVGNVLSQARELAVQGSNETLDADDRRSIAQNVRALRDAALSSLNGRGPDGAPLLSGSQLGDPFSSTGAYQGDAVTREVEVGEGLQLAASLPGSRLTAASGVDVLGSLDALASALESNDPNAVRASLSSIQTATSQVAQARAEIGARLRGLDQAEDARSELLISLTEVKSRAVEQDPIEGATTLAQAATALEAARASAERIFSLSQPR
jgi:flagellar hook-associated protein 3 FlgL